MPDLPDCRYALQTLWQDSDGDWWETFEIPASVTGQGKAVRVDNEIIRPSAASRTPPGDVLRDRNLCTYPAVVETVASSPVIEAMPATTVSTDGGVGLLLVLGLAGSAVWAWFNKGKDDHADDYHPMSDVPLLPPVYTTAQGNQTHGIPSEFAIEFDRNSHEFESNSQRAESANSHGIPHLSADSQDWPPNSIGAPYDPLQPGQPGEFEAYRRALAADGLNPKGNDIIKVLWGVTPGRSAAYESARKRRDAFAQRLDYYRREEL